MKKRHFIHIFILLILFTNTTAIYAAFVKGTVYDPYGQPLPFASIYIQGTSFGTTTNIDGQYNLELSPGEYTLVYQYVGYSQHIENFKIEHIDLLIDVNLKALDVQAAEVVVRAGEDPAYQIIREAIKKRKFYLEQNPAHSCDSYVKGTQKVQGLPEKIMGRPLGKLRDGLDSSGSGIVYLSESVSKLYFDRKKYKEIMISSKVSGDDNGFSFNSGVSMKEFNFYENQLILGDSRMLSPIAQSAMISYKYRLVGTFVDKGKIVSKIEVIPKNPMGNLFHGHIYIVNEDWYIHSTELKTTGQAANISMLDTVEFRQVHIILNDSVPMLFSQEIEFNMNVFGIKIFGRFLGVFKNYEIKPALDAKFYNAEVFKVIEDANKKENIYWDSIRPVPLTMEEVQEYALKDSLQIIWKSKAYLDSLDKIGNKPGFGMLLGGYTYRNRYERWSLSIPSPITSLSFNTVQGFYANIQLEYNKWFNDDRTKWFDIKTELQYGFSDKKIRAAGSFRYKFNDINDAQLEIEAGSRVQQYNSLEPISPLLNTIYSLVLRQNYAKLYERNFAEIRYSTRLFNAFYAIGHLSYQQRNPLQNNSDYSFFYQNSRSFFSNNPYDANIPGLQDSLFFSPHRHLGIELFLRIRFGQKYVSYPGRRFHIDSKYPEIWINYRKGLPYLGGNTDYDFLSITVQKTDIPTGSLGYLTFRTKYGLFLNKNRIEFPDFVHFLGNRTVYAKSNMHWRSYQLLPYYGFSTDRWFVEAHAEQDFKGFIWNKLPLLKKLGFENLAGYHFLYHPSLGQYMEFNFAISRIGWKQIRFGRLDFVSSYMPGQKIKFGMVFSLNFTL
jgi:hypothetical protein